MKMIKHSHPIDYRFEYYFNKMDSAYANCSQDIQLLWSDSPFGWFNVVVPRRVSGRRGSRAVGTAPGGRSPLDSEMKNCYRRDKWFVPLWARVHESQRWLLSFTRNYMAFPVCTECKISSTFAIKDVQSSADCDTKEGSTSICHWESRRKTARSFRVTNQAVKPALTEKVRRIKHFPVRGNTARIDVCWWRTCWKGSVIGGHISRTTKHAWIKRDRQA